MTPDLPFLTKCAIILFVAQILGGVNMFLQENIYDEEKGKVVKTEATGLTPDFIHVKYYLKSGKVTTSIVETNDNLLKEIDSFLSKSQSVMADDMPLVAISKYINYVKLYYRLNELVKFYKNTRLSNKSDFIYYDELSKMASKFKNITMCQLKNLKQIHCDYITNRSLMELLDFTISKNGNVDDIILMINYANGVLSPRSQLIKNAIYSSDQVQKWENLAFKEEENPLAHVIEKFETPAFARVRS